MDDFIHFRVSPEGTPYFHDELVMDITHNVSPHNVVELFPFTRGLGSEKFRIFAPDDLENLPEIIRGLRAWWKVVDIIYISPPWWEFFGLVPPPNST
jgi:hypothetical protein